MGKAERDVNRVPTLIGVSSATGTTPITVYVDPTTHELYVKTSINAGDIEIGAVEIKDGDSDTRVDVENDGVKNALVSKVSLYNIKITESGDYTYIAKAPVGTAQASAAWQAFRIDESSGLVILYADGDANFDNIATDLTALSYS